MVKTPNTYHNTKCVHCGHFFCGFTGLNLHNAMSRCGRIIKGTLSEIDKEQIAKYPKRWVK